MGIFTTKKKTVAKKKVETKAPARAIPKPKPIGGIVSEAMEEIIQQAKRANKYATPSGQECLNRIMAVARQVRALGD